MDYNLNERGTGFFKVSGYMCKIKLYTSLSLESTLNTAIMSYLNLLPCYERFSDAFGFAEVVCAVVVILSCLSQG